MHTWCISRDRLGEVGEKFDPIESASAQWRKEQVFAVKNNNYAGIIDFYRQKFVYLINLL